MEIEIQDEPSTDDTNQILITHENHSIVDAY